MSDDFGSKDIPAHHAEDKGFATTNGTHKTKRSCGSKVKAHYKRFWWLHLIILVVVVLVITLPLVYVGFPNIAQHEVNKSSINVTSMSILNPSPDSFDLELTSVLNTNSKYHPKLDGFNGSLHLEDSDTAFAYIQVPATPANNGAVSHIKQRVQIANMDAYTEYAKTVLESQNYTLTLKGRGGLKEGGLPKTNVNYNQKVTMAGFNGLKGFAVTEFSILTTTLPDGTNMNGTVSLPNPTVMTLAMGNVTLALSVAGTPIGISRLPNLLLHPGNNTIPMLATTNQSTVIGIILQPKYKSGVLPVDIVGKNATYNGTDLPYYDEALQSNKLSVELDVGAALTKAGLGSILNSTST